MWCFLKIRGTSLGVPIVRIIAFWAPYGGSPTLGNYHVASTLAGLVAAQEQVKE